MKNFVKLCLLGLFIGGCQTEVAEGEQYACTGHLQCAPGFYCGAGICKAGALPVDAAVDGAVDAEVPDAEIPDVAAPDAAPADSDGDGKVDALDNCPGVWNADQADADGDGYGDACDLCPDEPGREGCPSPCENLPDGEYCKIIEGWECPAGCRREALKHYRDGTCRGGACVPDGNGLQEHHEVCPVGMVCAPAGAGAPTACVSVESAPAEAGCMGDGCEGRLDGFVCAPAGRARCVAERCCPWSSNTMGCNEQGPRHPIPSRGVVGSRFMFLDNELHDTATDLAWFLPPGGPLEYPGLDHAHQACERLGADWHLPSVFELQTLTVNGPGGLELLALAAERLGPAAAIFVSSSVWYSADAGEVVPIGVSVRTGHQRLLRFPNEGEGVLFAACVRPLNVHEMDPYDRRDALKASPEAPGGLVTDPWTGIQWVDGTESDLTSWPPVDPCTNALGEVVGRPPDVAEALSVWQANPDGIPVDFGGPENRRFDWLQMANYGEGLRSSTGEAVNLPSVFFANPRPDDPGATSLVSFLDGTVKPIEAGTMGRVRCIRDP